MTIYQVDHWLVLICSWAMSPQVEIPVLFVMHGECDAKPTGYLPSICRYHFISFGDRGKYVCEQRAQRCTRKCSGHKSNPRPVQCKSITLDNPHTTLRCCRGIHTTAGSTQRRKSKYLGAPVTSDSGLYRVDLNVSNDLQLTMPGQLDSVGVPSIRKISSN